MQTHQAAERSMERGCCCSQRRADKAFGRKGLANDCIPHNPCTVIFTSKEPPIGSCGSGRSSLAVRLRPRTFNGERESNTDKGFCSVLSYVTFSTIPKDVWEEKSNQSIKRLRLAPQGAFGGFPGRVCVLGGLKGDLGCVQAEVVATSPCSGGTALLSPSAVLHRNQID